MSNTNKRDRDTTDPDFILFVTSRAVRQNTPEGIAGTGDISHVLSNLLTKDARESYEQGTSETMDNLRVGKAWNVSTRKAAEDSDEWDCEVFPDQQIGSTCQESADAYAQVADRARNESRPILLFVHGFNNKVTHPLQVAAKMRSKYHCEVIVFMWPTEGQVVKYALDRQDAILTARPFLRFINKSMNYLDEAGNHQPLNLLCHSMGCFVLENAVANTPVNSTVPDLQEGWVHLCGTQSIYSIFKNVIINAADVDSDGHVDWVKELKPKGKVFIFLNTDDDVLKLSDWVAGRVFLGTDHPKRLGQTLNHIEPTTRRVYVNVNVTVRDAFDIFQIMQMEHDYFRNGQGDIANFYNDVIQGSWTASAYRNTMDTGRRYYIVSGWSDE